MKKVALVIALAALVMLAGCKKDNQTNGTTLKAAIEQHKTDGSKTSINPDDRSISWTMGDKIKVNDGAEFTLTSIDGEGKGVFTHTGDYTFGENNIAVYPYAESTTINGNTLTMTLPDEQNLDAPGTFGNGANPMLATFSNPDNLTFTSLCGALCLQLKGDNIAITAIEIVGGADDKLNGTFTVADCTVAEPALTKSGDDGNSVVRLNCTTTLDATTAQKFFIVLPACTMANGFTMNVYNGADIIFTKSSVASVVMAKNTVTTMGELTVTLAPSSPTGTINSLFSVSATQQVYFSQGNLQYIGSAAAPYWKFAENQLDVLGNNGQAGDSQTVDRDLFSWGTSGYNHGATIYQPWTAYSMNSNFYAYGNSSYNLYDQTGQADWGYNAIANGGNTENSGWRTPTKDEWVYLFNTRTTPSGIRFAMANVNNVKGVIILPDNWNSTTYTLKNPNKSSSYNLNPITASDWTNVLEANGAVFLPVGGIRSDMVGLNESVYWSSSNSNDHVNFVYGVVFNNSTSPGFNPQSNVNRRYGCSVRLVRNAD